MRYLIYHEGKSFYANSFDEDNDYSDGMVVFDLIDNVFTDDGANWWMIE